MNWESRSDDHSPCPEIDQIRVTSLDTCTSSRGPGGVSGDNDDTNDISRDVNNEEPCKHRSQPLSSLCLSRFVERQHMNYGLLLL